MKKRLYICISTLCLSLALLFCACTNRTNEDEKPQVGSTPPPEQSVTLEQTEISLILGDETYIVPSFQTVGEGTVQFTSSNATVASVNQEGLVQALSQGETTITVSYGETSTSCVVKVSAGNYLPNLHFNYVVGDELTVSTIDRVNMSAYVTFNGKKFEDVTFTYSLDESVGSMENGFFTPKKAGETTLTVQGSWRGFEGITIRETFTVKVISAFEFYVNTGENSFSVHNREYVGTDYYGKAELDFTVYCYEDGKAVENVTVEIVEGADVIAYDKAAGKLKVLDEKAGVAKIVVTATDGKEDKHVIILTVNVYQSAPSNSGYFDPDWVVASSSEN